MTWLLCELRSTIIRPGLGTWVNSQERRDQRAQRWTTRPFRRVRVFSPAMTISLAILPALQDWRSRTNVVYLI